MDTSNATPDIFAALTLAGRLEAHAAIHDAHIPYDDEQRQFANDLRQAAAALRESEEWRRDAERYRAIRDGHCDWRLLVLNGRRWIELTGCPESIDQNADMDIQNNAIYAARNVVV